MIYGIGVDNTYTVSFNTNSSIACHINRYLIVIDDIWDTQSLETIRLALDGNSCGSRIITTTRKFDVATEAGDVYHLEPLSYGNSKNLQGYLVVK